MVQGRGTATLILRAHFGLARQEGLDEFAVRLDSTIILNAAPAARQGLLMQTTV